MFSSFNTLAITNYVNSGNARPELVSCCVHTSITSESETKQGIWNEWPVLEVCHRTWKWESQKYPCWWRPWLLFCQCWAWAPWNVCSCGICLAGPVDIQLCLKWEQCHQHNHNEGPELFLERLQSVSVADGATHTQKDDVESNGGSLENVAEVYVLFLCNLWLVLRSGVLTILNLDEVDAMPGFAEVFRSVLSGVGGSTGGWRCCWGAPSLPQLPPPCHFEEPTPLH